MRKVRITESQLKGLVRKMIKENIDQSLKEKGFTDAEIKNITSNQKALEVANKSLHLTKDQLKRTLEPHLKGIPMGTTTIAESQLRGLVRRMIKENVEKETSSIATIVKYYNQSKNNKLKQKISNYGNSRLPENPNNKQLYDFLNKIGDKNKLEMIKKMLEKDIESKSINESQLRGIVKRMIREEIQNESFNNFQKTNSQMDKKSMERVYGDSNDYPKELENIIYKFLGNLNNFGITKDLNKYNVYTWRRILDGVKLLGSFNNEQDAKNYILKNN